MKDKLQALVARIELSEISEDDKEQLYKIISEGLQATVWPILYKYMSKQKLDAFTNDPKTLTIQGYGSLIDEATKDGKALKELDAFMMDILNRVDEELKKHNI